MLQMYFVAFVCVKICAGKLGFKGICGVVISYGVRWFVKDAEIFPVYLMYRRAYFLKMFFLAGFFEN